MKKYPKATKRSAGVSEVKASLSEYLARVQRGEEILITSRGRPVARLVPVPPAEDDEDARMQELARQGLVRLPQKPLDEAFWKLPRPADPKGLVLKAVLEERRSGR